MEKERGEKIESGGEGEGRRKRGGVQEQGRKSVDACSDRMACMLHYPLV